MKPGTNKMPVMPRIDHGQGLNLVAKLLKSLFSSNSPLIEDWQGASYGDTKRCQNSEAFIRKMQAKKKRLRKIRRRTIMAQRFPNRVRIKV